MSQWTLKFPIAVFTLVPCAQTAFVTIPVVAVLLIIGCGQSATRHDRYETVGRELRRNTDLAKQKNSNAIELIKAGKYSEAEKLLKDALDADVTFGPAHNNLGKVYFQEQQLYLAAWEFQYASKLMPDLPEPRNNLGLVLESVGRLDEAINCYDNAVKIRPDNSQFLGNDARARYRRGDHDDRLRGMLQELVLRDIRHDWNDWAKEQLARMGPVPTTQQ